MTTVRPLFRWSIWNINPFQLEILKASVCTFRSFFHDDVRYIVFSADADAVRDVLPVSVEVIETNACTSEFWDERFTWRKWSPRFRYDPQVTEVYVDIDFFLLRNPDQLRKFIKGTSKKYLSCREEFYDSVPYGLFSSRIDRRFEPINGGLLGQRAGNDLSDEFEQHYMWWRDKVDTGTEPPQYHDEQGAIACLLQPYLRSRDAEVLDGEKYRIVCPRNLGHVDVDELVAMHATDHGHPAYAAYKEKIWQVAEKGAR